CGVKMCGIRFLQNQIPYNLYLSDTPPPRIYNPTLHDALPICDPRLRRETLLPRRTSRTPGKERPGNPSAPSLGQRAFGGEAQPRSEEHTSELQSRENLVCRLLLEKKITYRNVSLVLQVNPRML